MRSGFAFVAALLCAWAGFPRAGTAAPDPRTAAAPDAGCGIETSGFFPPVFVEKVLTRRGIEPGLRAKVEGALAGDEAKIESEVTRRAASMHPNPLLETDRRVAMGLYRSVLLERFAAAFRLAGDSNGTRVEDVFDDVEYLRAVKMAQCAGVADRVEIPRGVIPIRRTLTPAETVLLFPEAIPPSVRKQWIEEAKAGTVEKRTKEKEKEKKKTEPR